MRVVAFAAAVLLAVSVACGSSTKETVPPTCQAACDYLFNSRDATPPGCGFSTITVTDPSTGSQAQVDQQGCTSSCAKLDRRTAYQCILEDGGTVDEPAKVPCDQADHLSGCLSTFACTQVQLRVGACFGASPEVNALAESCVKSLPEWRACIQCVTTRTCAQMRGECEGPCRVPGGGGSGGSGGSGGGGGGGAGGGGSGGGGAGGS